MRCPKCQAENTPDSKYCKECSVSLPSPSDIPFPRTKTLVTPIAEMIARSTFAGRYKIIEALGEGGMGKVYRAFDEKLNEEAALLLEREKRTFLTRARACLSPNRPAGVRGAQFEKSV